MAVLAFSRARSSKPGMEEEPPSSDGGALMTRSACCSQESAESGSSQTSAGGAGVKGDGIENPGVVSFDESDDQPDNSMKNYLEYLDEARSAANEMTCWAEPPEMQDPFEVEQAGVVAGVPTGVAPVAGSGAWCVGDIGVRVLKEGIASSTFPSGVPLARALGASDRGCSGCTARCASRREAPSHDGQAGSLSQCGSAPSGASAA